MQTHQWFSRFGFNAEGTLLQEDPYLTELLVSMTKQRLRSDMGLGEVSNVSCFSITTTSLFYSAPRFSPWCAVVVTILYENVRTPSTSLTFMEHIRACNIAPKCFVVFFFGRKRNPQIVHCQYFTLGRLHCRLGSFFSPTITSTRSLWRC